MLRQIIIHPDPRLKTVSDPVAEVDGALAALIDDMLDTMYHAPGIGLAAPQLGIKTRLVVMDTANVEEGEKPRPMALINPEILSGSDETKTYREGCLSLPDIYEDVTRPAEVRVRFVNRAGEVEELDFDGLDAVCVQHEIDHLDGKLFIDYLGPIKRQLITQKMKKLKRDRARAL
ncbi:MAG: peptide deformylase [Pikeienuella sp.]